MNSIERRKTLLNYLKQSEDPITGSQLSKIFDVTRQIIVADIALLHQRGRYYGTLGDTFMLVNKVKNSAKNCIHPFTRS